MKVFWACLLLLIPTKAWAQDQIVQTPPECRILPDHKASADIAYQPGVDVHGKAVVPADINAGPMADLGRTVVVPLTVDLARRLQNQNVQGLQLEGNLGYLEVAGDGRVTYNGQDVTPQVYVLCGKQPISGDGQPPEDVIKYDPAPPQPAPAKPVAAPKPVLPAPVPKPVERMGELIEGEEYREEGIHE